MIVIPTSETLPNYVQDTALDGRDYRLRFRWNARISRWSLGVYTESEDPIVEGVLLVSGVSLLRKVADARVPPGILAVQSVDGAPPGLSDFHPRGRTRLVYWPEAEVAGVVANG